MEALFFIQKINRQSSDLKNWINVTINLFKPTARYEMNAKQVRYFWNWCTFSSKELQ